MATASEAPISVRDARDEDRQMAASLLSPDSERGRTSLRMLAEGQGRLWIAVAHEQEGERIVGVLLADSRRDGDLGERVGYIQELLVHPAYRRRGVAMHLLDAAEAAFFADAETAAVTLVTSPENEGALRLYRSRGYSVDQVAVRKRRVEGSGGVSGMAAISFDRAADDYDATRGYPPQVAADIGRALFALAGGRPGVRVLEIGAGTGRIAIPLAQAGADITGIDVSPLMLERMRAKWAALLAGQGAVSAGGTLSTQVGDITELPYPAATFDAVVAVHILHLVSGWRAALDEALRVLRPAGALLIGQDRWPGAVAIQMQEQWEAIVAELGFDPRRPGAGFSGVLDELRARGLAVDVTVPVTWVVRRTPRAYLDHLAVRSSSSTWAVPEAIFAASLTRMRAWAEERFGPALDEVVEEHGEFHVARAWSSSPGPFPSAEGKG